MPLEKRYRDFLQDADTAAKLENNPNGYEKVEVMKILEPLCARVQEPTDLTGHGTHVAGIILQLAPDARLFVARVFEYDVVSDAGVGAAARRLALVCFFQCYII